MPTTPVRAPEDGFRMSQINEQMVNKDVQDLKAAVRELQEVVTLMIQTFTKGR